MKKKPFPIKTVLSDSAIRSFEPYFADRLMRRIRSLDQKTDLSADLYQSLICMAKPVFTGACILFIALVFCNLLETGRLSIASALAVNNVTFEDVFIPTFSLFQ
jgi:hypothetical protein